jgi:hypothetical protein
MRRLSMLARRAAPVALALGLVGLAPARGVAHATPPPPPSNAVNIFLKAGDAQAVATCLNIAAHNVHAVNQVSRCRNVVHATGGDLVIFGADISALQTNNTTVGNPAQSNVTLAATGGNATALASCVNTVGSAAKVRQVNYCTNVAIATGGTVVLINVNVAGVQLNG